MVQFEVISFEDFSWIPGQSLSLLTSYGIRHMILELEFNCEYIINVNYVNICSGYKRMHEAMSSSSGISDIIAGLEETVAHFWSLKLRRK